MVCDSFAILIACIPFHSQMQTDKERERVRRKERKRDRINSIRNGNGECAHRKWKASKNGRIQCWSKVMENHSKVHFRLFALCSFFTQFLSHFPSLIRNSNKETHCFAQRRLNKGNENSETEMVLMNYNGHENRTIYHSFSCFWANSYGFSPFFRSTFCNVAHSPWFTLRSNFDSFSFSFAFRFICNFVHKLYYYDWFFLLVFSSIRSQTNSQSHAVSTELKIESHFSYRFIFGYRYSHRRHRRSDYVTPSNGFCLRVVNLKMSMKLNDRVEEFILNFSLHLGIWELAAFLFFLLF